MLLKKKIGTWHEKGEKMVLPEKNLLAVFAGLLALLAVLGIVWVAYFSVPPESPGPGPGPPIPPEPSKDGTPTPPPSGLLNIVVIYTDDQRWDTLWAMPSVQKELMEKGVTFTNAFQTDPICCPSRASFLSGGFYSFNTGVVSNHLPNGGATMFHDGKTLATELQRKGYKTAMIGKYLNDYEKLMPYIPPGWTLFVETDKGRWDNYTVVRGNSLPDSLGRGIISSGTQYMTDFLRDETLDFIDAHEKEAFFIYLTPNAPHSPATPAPGDEGLFSDFFYEVPSLGERDLSDKPDYVRQKGGEYDDDDKGIEQPEFKLKQLRSLQAVDRMVQAVVDKLDEKNLLDRTVIVFASDNGFMWGEHGLYSKNMAYEESIRVPLVVRMPGVGKKTEDKMVAVNLDMPRTIIGLAGIRLGSDGLDLMPLLLGKSVDWRGGLVFQGWSSKPQKSFSGTDWAAWRTENFKYVEYITGEKEFYDLRNDPFELESRHDEGQFEDEMEEFSQKISQASGIDVAVPEINPASVGRSYEFELKAKWGKPPYKWEVLEDEAPFKEGNKGNKKVDCFQRLPEGLELLPDGTIRGTPEKNETCAFVVQVKDSSVSPQHGGPQQYTTIFIMDVT